MDGKTNGVTIDGDILNGHGGGARGTAPVTMEASWEGQCCGQERSVVFSTALSAEVLFETFAEGENRSLRRV